MQSMKMNYEYELKYSFLKGTLENVTCVTLCKAKKTFQTSKFVASGLGPVVQSIVSFTSSLRVISLTVLADSIYNILIFFAEKM